VAKGKRTEGRSGGEEGPGEGLPGFGRVLAVLLAGWALESIHYGALLSLYRVGPPTGAAEKALIVLVTGLPAMFARLIFFMGALWAMAWLFGARVDGRRALVAAAWGSLALGVVAAALTPLAGRAELLAYLNVVYAAELAAAALGMLWALRGPVRVEAGLARLAAAVAAAVLLVGATPAALATPQGAVYGLLYSVAARGAAGG
jgi:hypothetical protein